MTPGSQLAPEFVSHAAPQPVLVRAQQPALALFAIGLVGLGILALTYGDFALVWQPVAAWVPGRTALAYGSGVLMLLLGVGLLFQATVAWSTRILFPYLIVWALLKVPAFFVAWRIEGVWLGFGELAMLLAGGWMLFARHAALRDDSIFAFAYGDRGVRIARYLFALWVIPVGLSHFIYFKATDQLIPAWLPFHTGWAYLTGAGHIACGLALLFSVLPRLAAYAEAGMIGIFTLLVWAPAIIAAPQQRLPWTAFFISWIIGAAALAVAQTVTPGKPERASFNA
ncbi:MAG TPA: DoxX family protein [Terracidiphilus sp.]|jgi:uncharacterized membrane protein